MRRRARSLGPCLKSCSVPRSGVTEWSRWAPLVPGARAQLCRCEHAPGNCRPSLSLAAPFFITPRPGARQASFAEPLERRPAVTRSKLGLKNGAIVAALDHLKAPILRDAGTRAFPRRVLPGCARLRAPPSARKIQIGRVTKFTKIGKTPPQPDKSVPHHRAIEAAPQGVVADRDGTCDGDVPQATPTRARKNYQVGAVGVHRRGHAGQRAEAWCHNLVLMTTKMT